MPVYGKIILQRFNGSDGMQFVLSTLSCVIGRDDECDIRLTNTGVSREHCQLVVRENGEVYLANISNVGTTLLNDRPITNAKPLHHLDVFTVGGRSFRWEFTQEFLHTRSQIRSGKVSTPAMKVQTPARKRSAGKTPRKSKSPNTPNTASMVSRRSRKRTPRSAMKPSTSPAITPRSVKKTPKKSKSPRKSITPKTGPNSQLVAAEKSSGKKLSPPAKQTNDVKNISKAKKNSRKRKAKKIVSTKVKMIKANPTPNRKKNDDLSLSSFDTPNITQDIFVSPLDTETSTKQTVKRRSTGGIMIGEQQSAKKVRPSPKTNDSTPTKTRSGAARSGAPQTPLSSRKPTRVPNRKKQNTPIPDYTSVEGMKRLFRESGPLPDYSNIAGLKNMLRNRTPDADYTNASGLKRLFSKTPKDDYTNVAGVKKLFGKSVTPDYSNVGGLKRLQRKSKTPNLNDISGVAQLFDTPEAKTTPRSARRHENMLRKALQTSIESTNSPRKMGKRNSSPRSLSVTLARLKSASNSPSPTKTPQSLKRKSTSLTCSSLLRKKMSLTKSTSPDDAENVSLTNESIGVGDKTPLRRPPRGGRRAAKTGDNSAVKTPSPKQTRSLRKTPARSRSAAKVTGVVEATPRSRVRKVKETVVDDDKFSPPKSARKRVVKAKTTTENDVSKSAKTPTNRKAKAAKTPASRRKKVVKENDDKFEEKLSPLEGINTSKTTKSRRKIVVATSPVGVALRRSKRSVKKL